MQIGMKSFVNSQFCIFYDIYFQKHGQKAKVYGKAPWLCGPNFEFVALAIDEILIFLVFLHFFQMEAKNESFLHFFITWTMKPIENMIWF